MEFLGSHVVKALSVGSASRGPAQLRGVEVAPLPGQGRSLLAKRDLARGSVCIQEQPLASVASVGEASLQAETRLALQLLAASRANLADLAADLLDHGGRDPMALKSRAVVAVCAVLCIFAALSNLRMSVKVRLLRLPVWDDFASFVRSFERRALQEIDQQLEIQPSEQHALQDVIL